MGARSSENLKTVSVVGDFVAVPLQIPSTFSFTSTPVVHYLYLRPNAPRIPTDKTPREIFAVNVPIDATDAHFRSLFADGLGGARLESVAFEGSRVRSGITAPVAPVKSKKRKRYSGETGGDASQPHEVGALPEVWDRELHCSGTSAILTLVDKASVDLAMREARRAAKSGRGLTWAPGPKASLALLGSARYRSHHQLRFPEHAELQRCVDTFMEAFTAQETARNKALAKQRSVPDEDGFITVTRGGRNGPAREDDTKLKEEELKQRERNRVKDDFYRFQTREKKKEVAKSLVRAFEEDAKKVAEMRKKKNKFRPE